jgi:holo-[acyl-carrier protein] synthase
VRIVGIGVDVVEVDRVERLLRDRPSFRTRVFTEDERRYCDQKSSPAGSYAARWAAREAARKALGGVRGLRWHDISVGRARSGAPHVVLTGSARARADQVGVDQILVSFSHERSIATAFCVAVGSE